VVFLAAYAWPILQPTLDPRWLTACSVVAWGTWAMFVVDYLVRLVLADRRGEFVRQHLLDLAVIALPILRPLRLLRLVTLLGVLNRRAATSLRGRVAVYVAGGVTLIVFCAALAALDAERSNPDANIKTFPDALWWAATTVTTVGYGDRYPTTGAGRLIATGLMVAGIALFGMVAASLASWLIEKVSQVEGAPQAATRRDIEALTAEVAALRQQVEHNHRTPSFPSGRLRP